MGSGKRRHWFIGENSFWQEGMNEKLLFKINIPIFHHSMGEVKNSSLNKSLDFQQFV